MLIVENKYWALMDLYKAQKKCENEVSIWLILCKDDFLENYSPAWLLHKLSMPNLESIQLNVVHPLSPLKDHLEAFFSQIYNHLCFNLNIQW